MSMRAFILFVLLLFCYHTWAFTVVFIGDSLTEGYSLAKSSAYPALIEQKLLEINPKSKVINAGVSGATSQSAVSQMKWYIKLKPDLIMIALGANDGLRGLPVKQMKKNLSDAIKLAQQEKVKVALAGMKLPTNYGKRYRRDFERAYSDIAKEFNLIYIPFLLEGVAMVPNLNLDDKIHPNEKGHQIIAETVWPYIKKGLGL